MNKKGTIFLVDDDSSALKGLTRLLLAAGYEVNAYASSDDLLKSSITDKNACLILDAQMPGLSGVELQAELAKKGVNLPVIFVTADDDEETRQKARALKAAGFFLKPVDGPALLDAVAWALETHGLYDGHKV
jgi:FixJ family two-component response regulator